MPQPDFLGSIDARMALETPQIMTSWEFASPVSPLDPDVTWPWAALRLRRSTYHYPETAYEGDSILMESYSTAPSTSKADLLVLEDLTYYYSLFFQYPEMSTNDRVARLDVKRLYSTVRGMVAVPFKVKVSGADLQTTLGGTTVTSAGSTFRTLGAEAGDWLVISAGPNAGSYPISRVTSETQLLLVSSTPNAGTGQSFTVRSDEPRWALGGTTHERHEVVFVYNSQTGMVDRALDLSSVLAFGEYLTGVLCFDDTGANEKLQVTTNWRYLRFANLVSGALPDTLTTNYLTNQLAFDGKLRGGYNVTGATVMQNMEAVPVGDYIALLDSAHREARAFIWFGGVWTHMRTYDLSGLESDDLVGLSQDTHGSGSDTYLLVGNKNWVYSIDAHNGTEPEIIPYIFPVTADHIRRVTYVQDLLDGAIAWNSEGYTYLGTNEVATICNLAGLWDLYTVTVGRGYLWQQEHVADGNTVGLYHFTAGSELVDSGPWGSNALNNGMVHEDTGGKYNGGCYRADNLADYLDLSAIVGEFNGAEGSASVWFRASDPATLTTGTGLFLVLQVNSSNRVRIGIVGNDLYFGYDAGGTGKYIFGTHPSPDLAWHSYKLVWSLGGNYLKAYLDGVQFLGTLTGVGTWAGALTLARVGGDSSNSALGYYDEVRISDVPRVVSPAVLAWTDQNTAHAYSGRDPLTRSFNWRDELWSPRFMGGDWFIRNDYGVELTPVDKILADGEVVFRQPTKNLGDLGRLSRLLGLWMDRLADDRDHRLDAMLNPEKADDDYLEALADRFGIKGFEPSWNVDQHRRWVVQMRRVLRTGGTVTSYHRLSELLGYRLRQHILYSRRRLDSVIDPTRADVYLDEQGSLDTNDLNYPLAKLCCQWYKQAAYYQGGEPWPGNLLTDSTAAFNLTAKAGSLVRIYNPGDPSNDGDYLVVSVIDATTLLLDQPLPDLFCTGFHYSVNWHVPPPDPTVLYLLNRMDFVRPRVMSVEAL